MLRIEPAHDILEEHHDINELPKEKRHGDITLHINETLHEDQIQELENSLRHHNGVLDVHFKKGNPHLAVIRFDVALLSGKKILEMVQQFDFTGDHQLDSVIDVHLHAQATGL